MLSRFFFRYYRLFMYHYSLCLRTASFLMVNSTWTKTHVDAILRHSDLLIDCLYLFPPLLAARCLFLSNNAPSQSSIVYPPCDTRQIEKFPLTPRERIILSVAQFRLVDSASLHCHCWISSLDQKRTTKLKYLLSIDFFSIILSIYQHPMAVL